MLDPFLNRKRDLSVRNGVLIYKQLIRPVMDYACPAWRSAPRSHVRSYRCCNPRVFALLLLPLVRNRRINEDLGVPLFPDHIRALRASLDSKLADVENLLVRQLGRYLR